MNFLKTVFESPMVYRLGWSLLHFLWEGAAIAVVLAIGLAILRRTAAGARYLACGGALLLLAAAPIVTFFLVPAPLKTAVASGASGVSHKAPAVDLLNAPPVRKTGNASIVPVSAPGPVNHANVKAPVAAKSSPFVASAVAEGAKGSMITRAFRQSLDFLPRVLPWLVLAWCAGAIILSIYNLGGWMAVRRLRLLATRPVATELADNASRLARRMGISRAVRLLQSTLIDSPMVIGALKPIILLPASLLSTLSPAQLESLLAHELAHIGRHDYLVNLLQGVIETLLFYHPAVWWVSRRIRLERELCCDDQVIAITQNRTAYVRALAAVAERKEGREVFSSRRAASGNFAVAASGGALLSRVRRLLGLPDADAARSPRWLAGAVAMMLCLFAGGAIVARAADKPARPKDKDFDAPKTWFLDLEVVDKSLNEPIPKLSLAVNVDNRRASFITDDQGHAQIEYTEGAKYLAITPKSDSYVPINLTWRSFSSKDPIPDTYKLVLERGTTIGGIVQDEAGNPVANVSVQLSIPYKNGEESGRVQIDLYNHPVKTDGQGRWRCDFVPKDLDQPFVRLSHPDYLSDEMFGQTAAPPLPKLRDMTGIMVLQKGLPVAGRVLDDQGNPIANAKVYQGADRFGSNYPETKTNAEGKFSFAHCRGGGELVLTVTAKGRAPDQKTLRLDKAMEDIEFRLEPGHTIKGRVVDADGKPIPKVLIATDTWRGHRALLARLDTDDEGRFLWNEAPADEILADFLKQGYMDHRRVEIKASDVEMVVTLRHPTHVTGTVVDTETGKPVDKFKVVQGISWENQQEVSWQRGDPAIQPKDGKFEFDITGSYPAYAVRIESLDYEPSVSRIFKETEGNVSLELKLKKGRALAGILKTPAGKPLAGADVVVCTGTNGPYITNGRIQQHSQQPAVKSDDNGRYQIPPQTGKFSLVVVTDFGYAEVSAAQLAKSFDITVQPWGKVEGTLRIGSKPGARQTIKVNRQEAPGALQEMPRVYHDLGVTTDEQGHFAVDHVPPGKASVGMQVQFSQYTYGFTQSRTVEIKAGETTAIDIGGVGRPVIGKLVAPPELAGKMNATYDNTYMMSKIENLPDYRPANWGDMSEDARKNFVAEYLKSPKYLEYMKKIETRHQFSIKVESSGKFRVDDVPAGIYQFSSIVNEPSNETRFGTEAIATASLDITVPEMAGGRSDEVLDVGNIMFKAVKRVNVGDAAPDFSVKSTDDKVLKLSDYKGKHVLVHFWAATYPQNAPADLPAIKAAVDRYGKDGRLVVLGLNMDEKPDVAKKFIASNAMTWPQGMLGEWGKSKVPEDWCLRTLPAVFLISPEGKVLGKDLKGTTLTTAIESAMKAGK